MPARLTDRRIIVTTEVIEFDPEYLGALAKRIKEANNQEKTVTTEIESVYVEPKDTFHSAFLELTEFFHRRDETTYEDAIQDLLHLAVRYNHDVDEILRHARENFELAYQAWADFEELRMNLPFRPFQDFDARIQG